MTLSIILFYYLLNNHNALIPLILSFFPFSPQPSSPANHCIQTDASEGWGCGAFFEGKWLQWQWPNEWHTASIMAKELVPITLSCAVWGPKLSRAKVLVQCDNLGLVAAISKGSSWGKDVMCLLRCMWFLVAYFDIDLHAEHIGGVSNITADQLSRNYMQSFSPPIPRYHCCQHHSHHPSCR